MSEGRIESENVFKAMKIRWPIFVLSIALILSTFFEKYLKIDSEILYYLLSGIFIIWIAKRNKMNIKNLVGKLPNFKDNISPFGVFICVCIFSVASLLIIFFLMTFLIDINRVVGLNSEVFSKIHTVKQTQSLTKIILTVIDPILLAPVFEEIFFRGILLHRLSEKFNSIRIGIFLSSVLFGILHLWGFFGAFIFGVFTSVIYIKTKKLLVPILYHSLYNSYNVLMMFNSTSNNSEIDFSEIGIVRMAFLIFGFIGISLTIPFIFRYVRKNISESNNKLPYFINSLD
ncbi:CPBP family intramembrane glutamic endopeptidase [Desulfitobacterium sp. Sab5]|uniref:CPBP family intramembrane glutamic endopeptidase n=1 Tax=Desulfitobacterium nosdiversum TaxID=3375356 RepID=UPI003CFAD023